MNALDCNRLFAKAMKKLRNSFRIFILSTIVISSLGWMDVLFSSWEATVRESPYIILVRCTSSPPPTRLINGVMSDNPLRVSISGGITLSDVKMIAALKAEPGRLAAGEVAPALRAGDSLTLWSRYRPCQGDDYLLFASSIENTNCYAPSEYRVVPLGHSFDTNWLSGKSLDQQIKFMLQYRLSNLNQELQKGEEEKKRLEESANIPTNNASNPPPALPKTTP